ncbi:site-2 protease family protein [Aporhodopirellula aestuarii]|uniref:Site-2 protease family protein n=1 Tax=Aporhodopirellula aestuarii TaxID=2950107 RepID=A0ABT0TXT9_9BACT|nr:site-2 protease family protein [Aporhodopirellula aestuarii]MCM2369412.1 site-2 protease family protein [Aporhodopirellula aestuarii]
MNQHNEIRPVIRPTIRLRTQSEANGAAALTNVDSTPQDTAGNGGLSESADPFAVNDSGATIGIEGTPSSGREFYQSGSIWTPDDSRKSELVTAVRAIENKSTGGFTKFVVLLVSLAVFVAAGVAWWDPWIVSMLVVVLLFHEAGHYVAMRVFGYRNVKMFFIPFLGAAVSGRHFNISGWKKALVYLAGPVPGIIASLPLMIAGIALETDWMLELGGMGLLLNTLNLLPIMPLDGGWIMHLTVFSRSPILELVARMLGILAMFAFAIFTNSIFILFIAIPLVMSLPTNFRIAKLIRRLRDRPLPQPERDEIPDAAIHLLDHEIQSTPLAPTPTQNKAAMIVQMYESLIVKPPGIGATLAIWMVYGGAFLIAIFGGIGILIGRDFFQGGLFDDELFDATEHRVSLDVDDTQFQLGTEPIDGSYLAVARFNSAAELEAAKRSLRDDDLKKFTHARFGNVWLASIPKDPDKTDAEEEELFDDEFADDSDEEFQERMRRLFRPIDPAETWIAKIASDNAANKRHRAPDVAGLDEGVQQELPSPGGPVVDVISGLHHSSIQIRATAPDADAADQVLKNYFQMPRAGNERLYMPAWSPLDPPTPSQIQCRTVLKLLLDGITRDSAPDLFEQRQQIGKEQYEQFDADNYDPRQAAVFASRIRELQLRYTAEVLSGLEGEQAEVGRMYQRYQQDELAFQALVEQRSIEAQARIAAGEPAGSDAEDDADEEYPLLDDYLVDETNLLGFSDPTRRSHHFASHVSGSVLTPDDVLAEMAGDDDEMLIVPAISDDEDVRYLNLSIHRATDQTATISAIVAFLNQRGFHDFELLYATPTADFD